MIPAVGFWGNYETKMMRDLAVSTHAENARIKITKMLFDYAVGTADSYNSAPKPLLLSAMKDPNLVVATLQTAVLDMAPVLSKLFIDGAADGSIQMEYPLEYAEIFMLLLSIWLKPTLFSRDVPETKRRLQAFQQLMRHLGADIISDETIEKVLTFYRENDLI